MHQAQQRRVLRVERERARVVGTEEDTLLPDERTWLGLGLGLWLGLGLGLSLGLGLGLGLRSSGSRSTHTREVQYLS